MFLKNFGQKLTKSNSYSNNNNNNNKSLLFF